MPETDDDAVRILTIHGAKGLEFPIVIASGTTTAAQAPRRGVQVLFPAGGWIRGPPERPRADGTLRAAPAGRRADGLPREAAAAVRRVHAVPAITWSCRHTARHACSTASIRAAGHTPSCCGTRRARRSGTHTRTTGPRRRRRAPECVPSHPRRSRSGTPRTSARSTRGNRRTFVSATALGEARGRAERDRRSRSREGRPRPRAATLEQGSLRHGDRPGGACRAPDRRPRIRRRHHGDRGRAGSGRRCARTGGDHRRAGAVRDRKPGRAARGRPVLLAGDLRRRPARRDHARGLRRPRVPRR